MKSDTQRQREMLYEQPYEKWPLFAKAMGWELGRDPEWMTSEDRDWFWRTVDYEAAKAEKRAAEDRAWTDFTTALSAPFVRVLDWLARRIG